MTRLLPFIAAPHDSGVTQADLDDALIALVERRTLDLLRAISADADRITETMDALVASADTSDHSMARALRVIDTHHEQIARHRLALQYRLDALRAARATAQSSDDATLTLLKASA